MDKFIGKTLDNRYEILDILGIGGMAYVYKARCHLLNRFVAIKILKEEFAKDADFRKRFHAESQAVAMLSHPNITAVYDISRSKSYEYIVMELIDGITLKQYMQKKASKLSWRECLHFAIQIVKALSHAHSRGIIHRDIKPHNIMILKDGSVKVADFGIARFAGKQHTLSKEALGSVHYISPEQARGSHIDARSDIYSVGVVLYEMLTERLPFEGDSPVSVALQHISSLPLSPREINPNIPQALEMIILKAMAPKLSQRYDSAEEMYKDLEEFRKNPAISFNYNVADLQMAADEKSATRPLPGGTKGKGLGLEEAERDRIRNELIEDENNKTRKSGNLIATLSAVFGVLVVVGILSVVIINMLGGVLSPNGDDNNADSVTVPDFIGETFTSLADLEEEHPYFEFEYEREPNRDHAENIIFRQDPRPDIRVARNQTINLTVSAGWETVAIQDLRGISREEAERRLRSERLEYEHYFEDNDDVPEGDVIRTEPEAGETVFVGDTVTLFISSGAEFNMPNLIGLTETEARDMLNQYNLTFGRRNLVDSDEPNGTVIWQSISTGTDVRAGDAVNINVSTGPAEEPPDATDPPDDDDPPDDQQPDATPDPSPDPSPPQPERVTFLQPIGIPPGAEGFDTVRLRVEVAGVTIFDNNVQANSTFELQISGYPNDIVRVFFNDTQHHERTIAVLLES